ncbi:MAG TPA: phosphoribosyltransferase [Holophaga sp.]|nr:phosphoribosyltransferase [Holophaga sp.]
MSPPVYYHQPVPPVSLAAGRRKAGLERGIGLRYSRTVLHRLVYADWDDPPECMAFEAPYEEVLTRIQALLPGILDGKAAALAAPAEMPARYWDDCVSLYLLAPALVNVALNYKVCVEQGLPLHPTYYFEVGETSRFKARYPDHMITHTNEFFQASIETARAIYALRPDAPARLGAFIESLPEIISGFIYTSTKDKYTWRASNPSKIQDLADYIRKHVAPALIVGAAHGSILSGLVLSNILDVPVYFIRFSMFKRNDTAPIIAPSDTTYLDPYRAGPVLLFDEDVAKGTTLTKFAETLKPFFEESYTASVLRHALSPCMPDFIGRSWHD